MASRSFWRVIGIALLSLAVSAWVFIGTAIPAAAYDVFSPRFDVSVSLDMDSVAHAGMVVDVDLGASQAKAFMSKARDHDLFNGDHFGFGRIEPRL